jgi:hypothetical protein
MLNNFVWQDTNGMPFFMPNTRTYTGTSWIVCKNNWWDSSSPINVNVHDFEGNTNQSAIPAGGGIFNSVVFEPNILRFKESNDQNTTGLNHYGTGWMVLHHVRGLSEGTIPQVIATATFTGSITGSVMGINSMTSGVIQPGMLISGTGVVATTLILSFGTGTGGTGTYNLSQNSPVGSETLTGTSLSGGSPGQNLRITAKFASSNSVSVTFQRTLNISSPCGQAPPILANTGQFFPSDCGKPLQVPGAGPTGTTWFGYIVSVTDATHAVSQPAVPCQDLSLGGPTAATIGANEPDANYLIVGLTGNANETFWADTLTASGFTLHSSNATSTAKVNCMIVR